MTLLTNEANIACGWRTPGVPKCIPWKVTNIRKGIPIRTLSGAAASRSCGRRSAVGGIRYSQRMRDRCSRFVLAVSSRAPSLGAD